MKRGPTGRYVKVSTAGEEEFRAFIPGPLPPDPPIQIDDELQEIMQHRPVISMAEIVQATGLSFPTVTASVRVLEKLAIARELTGQRRSRLFGYDQYIKILSEGTEPG